ncbi:MAG: PadR family transcriptional regulator, partial [Chloroflexia bacterium]
HATAVTWLREMLSTPAQEFPEFPAAVSLLPLLTTEDAIRQMEIREGKLAAQVAAINKEMESMEGNLPRLFLLESEYMRIVLGAELSWVRSIIYDLRSGELTWHQEWMHPLAPPKTEE